MAASDYHDPDRDLPLNHDFIEIFRNRIHMKKVGPQGWWYLNLDKGLLPPQFKGAYLTYLDARYAAEKYAQLKKIKYGKEPVDVA